VYDRKYRELYDDGNSGCTTPKKIWEDSRKKGSGGCSNFNTDVPSINCTCCTNYRAWLQRHPEDAQKLKEVAKVPYHYKVYANKLFLQVIVDGAEVVLSIQ